MGTHNLQTSDSIKEKLFRVGLNHYLKEGAKGFSIRKITTECEVNLGSFVYHFGTKEFFLKQLLDRHYSNMLTRLEKYLVSIQNDEVSIEALRHLIDIMMGFIEDNPEFIERLILDLLSGDKTIIKALIETPPRHLPIIVDIISQCQERGMIKKDMSAIQAGIYGMFVSGMINILGSTVATHTPAPFGEMLKIEIQDPHFRKNRIDMIIRGIEA